MFKVITGTLQANHNTMQITDNIIENSYIYEIYVNSTSDVIPQSIDVSGHTLIVTFDSKPTNNVLCKVLMFDDMISSSDISYLDGIHTPTVQTVLDGIAEELQDFNRGLTTITTKVNNIDSRIPTDTILGGVLYHATTGNTWKKLDASNLDYDNESTIYSAMGDIDELETENKNLVAAINEVNSKPTNALNYSTEEQNTGSKYIDGKYIYQRTFNNLTSPSGSSAVSVLETTPLNIDKVLNIEIQINAPTHSTFVGGGALTTWHQRVVQGSVNPSIRVQISNGTYYSQPMILTIRYTKND